MPSVADACSTADAVRSYAPSGPRAAEHWRSTRHVVGEMVLASTARVSTASKYLTHLADFAGWALEQGVPMDSVVLLDSEVVERYIAVGMRGAPDGTRATRRAVLRRIARHCGPQALLPPPTPIRYRRVRPPYTGAEVQQLLALALAQPTPARRRTLLAILHLGLGCGLASRDLSWVRGTDVSITPSGGALVVVSGGTRPRPVIALWPHEQALLELACSARESLLIGGQVRGRRNVTRGPLDDVVGGSDLPRLETARLRSTWLLTHLQARTPLPVLMSAAGLTTVRPLEDLLEHCPVPPMEAELFLRGTA